MCRVDTRAPLSTRIQCKGCEGLMVGNLFGGVWCHDCSLERSTCSRCGSAPSIFVELIERTFEDTMSSFHLRPLSRFPGGHDVVYTLLLLYGCHETALHILPLELFHLVVVYSVECSVTFMLLPFWKCVRNSSRPLEWIAPFVKLAKHCNESGEWRGFDGGGLDIGDKFSYGAGW